MRYLFYMCLSVMFLIFLFLCIDNINSIDLYKENLGLRIAEGEDANITDIPYVVRLTTSSKAICTGAIVNQSWILTAAHCVVKMGEITVTAGIDNLNDKDAQVRKGKRILVHDEYVPHKISKHDIALIEVDPFLLNNKVKAVEISGEAWPEDVMYNRPCVAAGWGIPELGEKAVTKLKKLNVAGRHGEKGCKCWQTFHNKRLVCLSGKMGSGVCKGDSGSALVCDNKAVGVAHVIYLVDSCNPLSYGQRQFNCKQTSGAYMYICPYLDWINKYVPNVPVKPASCKASQFNSIVLFAMSNLVLNNILSL